MIFNEKMREFHNQFISLKGKPSNIAMGMAIGIFIGVTPTIPFHTALIVMLVIIFRQNLTSAYLGCWIISNPITIPLFYIFEYELGRYLLGISSGRIIFMDYSINYLIKMGWQIVLPLLTGGMVLAPIFAVPAYIITYKFIVTKRKKQNL